MSREIIIRDHKDALSETYVLVFTSNSIEKKAVNNILEKSCSAVIGHDTSGCSLGLLSNRFILHICGESGISKSKSIGRIATYLLPNPEFPQPALVLLVGFCWGNLNLVKSDSVICATEICVLNEKQETVGETRYKPHRFYSPLNSEVALFEELKRTMEISGKHFVNGPIASLEIRYEANEARDELLQKFPELHGGEMEAFGVIPSCQFPWVVLKAVSDSGGDDFNTDRQTVAAIRAAEAIRDLVAVFEEQEVIPSITTKPVYEFLIDTINGDTVSFEKIFTSIEGLNDYLDSVVGPQIEYKLQSYSSELEYGANFVHIFCDLLLELMQNSIRHGAANYVNVKFTPSKIIYTDDGKQFEPQRLDGVKGGARAWSEAVKIFNADKMLSIKSKRGASNGNMYTFSLEKVARLLDQARRYCQVSIKPNQVGVSSHDNILHFDDKCDALYFEAFNVRMMSRRLSAISALRPLATSGKKIFIACSSNDEANLYKAEFQDLVGDQVVIFVK